LTTSGTRPALDDSHEVVVNGEPRDAPFDLFSRRPFHALHESAARQSYYIELQSRSSGRPVAAIRFHETEPGIMENPFRGPFGGVSIARGASMPLMMKEEFAAAVDKFLARQGARRISMVLPPMSYSEDQTSEWFDVFGRIGYSVSRQELTFGIQVAGRFEDRIDSGNRKRLHKCLRDGLRALELPPDQLQAAYDVIAENRRKHGHVLSMDWPAVAAMRDNFTSEVPCFGVVRDSELLAAAICLRVNPEALFVYAWGEVPGAETWSPVTMLAGQIFSYCQDHRIRLMDVGTANIAGAPNYGLIRYKRNLGCLATLKFTLVRDPS
jgi:hypothetical protein